jgi:hypothetical protein
MDFGDEPVLIAGAEVVNGVLVLAINIVSYTVTCTPTGAPTVSGKQLDYPYQVSAVFTGGTSQQAYYDAVFTITLNDADNTVISRTGQIKVS